MNISLPGPLKQWVERQVRRRGFSTASEYVRDLIRREQELEASTRSRIDEQLMDGLNSGEPTPMTDRDWQAVRREGRRRAASRKSA